MNMTKRLIVLSGSTGGLGKNIATEINSAELDDTLCLLYRDEEKISYASNLSCDVKKIEIDLECEIDGSIFDHIDFDAYDEMIIILTAFDIRPIDHLRYIKTDALKKNIDINIIGQTKLINLLLTKYNKNNVKIISLDSGASYEFIDGWGLYASAKNYINKYLEYLSKENGYGLVLYSPGVMDTSMQSYIRELPYTSCAVVDTFRKKYEEGNMRNPKYVAKDIVERYILEWKAVELRETVSNTEMRDKYL